jgi:hypothetical protein
MIYFYNHANYRYSIEVLSIKNITLLEAKKWGKSCLQLSSIMKLNKLSAAGPDLVLGLKMPIKSLF